jgi:hypothetical protein
VLLHGLCLLLQLHDSGLRCFCPRSLLRRRLPAASNGLCRLPQLTLKV